ncbi:MULTISPECIES: hypothetical protein [unclassified Dehalobacter]|uniref:hypothetical protein n=1 Tax=unclassified Dehalobacter TaxID=2635733 RepID=UPI001FAABD5C|nr:MULTISPECIES: hypothetical protein [unclassified Dehalobacter]
MLSVYVREIASLEEVIEECLSGNIVLLINGSSGALAMTGGGESCSVEMPQKIPWSED